MTAYERLSPSAQCAVDEARRRALAVLEQNGIETAGGHPEFDDILESISRFVLATNRGDSVVGWPEGGKR